MNNWNDLSLKEKAAMMKVAVGNGIYNLSDIRKAYNEYAEGGPEESLQLSSLEDTRSDTTRQGYNERALTYQGGDLVQNPFLQIFEALDTPYREGLVTGIAPTPGMADAKSILARNNSIKALIPRYNKFAKYYGYDVVPEGISIDDAEKLIKAGLDRHNTFYRGVTMPGEQDVTAIKNTIGKNATDREVLEYLIRKGSRNPGDTYLAPDARASMYAVDGDIAILKRKYKLSDNPENWLKDADFIYDTTPATGLAPENTVNYPWAGSFVEKAPPGEVRIHPNNYTFEGWLPKELDDFGYYVEPDNFKGSKNLWFNEEKGHHKPVFKYGGPIIQNANKFYDGGDGNQPYTPFLNETPETPMQAAIRQLQSPEAQAAYWNATHPQTTNETPIVAQPDGTFRRETRNIPLNTSAEAAKTALEFTPVVGDVMFAGDVANEARQGNYGTAAALAGLALLPNYAEKPLKKGLRKIGLFDNATTASKTSHTVSDIDYGSVGGKDYIKDLAAKNKIQGKPAWALGDIDFITGKPVKFSSDVSKGLSWEAREDLMNNTIERNLREFGKEGYDDLSRWQYQEKVKDLLNDVNVGRYTNEDYVKAGAEGMGGFYDDTRNFISVNTDNPSIPKKRIEAHEGRHLIDYNTSMLDSQHALLSKAYDDDFLNIPNTEFAGTLKDYKLMSKERVTTNRDSRDVLLSNKDLNNRSLKEQDTYIDNVSDEEIFNAVENSNGYGKKFIKFLRANNKLTPQKAQEFREAMKHVGGYAAPVAIGGTAAASYANQQSYGGPLVALANKYEEGGSTDESNNIVDWIIKEEGFNAKPEDIGDGKMTLGSGLTNPKWLKIYEEKGVWTPEDNRTAVTEEVEDRRKWSEENVPNWIELPTDSQNALLSYKYNYDFTPKNSPLMFQALRDRNYEEAARQMNATSSNPKFKKGLLARRQREQELFMRGINNMNNPKPVEIAEEPVAVPEEPIYTPPQRVLDNMAANNGKYMITGYPALASPRFGLFNAVKNSVLGAYASKALDWAKDHWFEEGGPTYRKSDKAYYDPDTDTVYAPDSIGEAYQHEMFHARPNHTLLDVLKPYYENLNDDRLRELGADLDFVKRLDNDPNHFYNPEEVGARIQAARYMLDKAGVDNIDDAFLNAARKNELQYGDNFRDLLHMYNNANLTDILNNEYSRGGKIYIKPSHRGKFTRLKERTGHSASWFKLHGTPAQKKMATFALNARKWKHGEGGPLIEAANIYDGETMPTQQMHRPYILTESETTPRAGYTPWGMTVAADTSNLNEGELGITLPDVNVGLDQININEKINQAQETAGKAGIIGAALGLTPAMAGVPGLGTVLNVGSNALNAYSIASNPLDVTNYIPYDRAAEAVAAPFKKYYNSYKYFKSEYPTLREAYKTYTENKKNLDNYKKSVREFYVNDVFPRAEKYGAKRFNEEALDKALSKVRFRNPISSALDMFVSGRAIQPVGISQGSDLLRKIQLNPFANNTDKTLVHEVGHYLHDKYKYPGLALERVADDFVPNYKNSSLNFLNWKGGLGKSGAMSDLGAEELEQTMREMRYAARQSFNKKYGRMPSVDEIDDYIKNKDDWDVASAFSRTNGYGEDITQAAFNEMQNSYPLLVSDTDFMLNGTASKLGKAVKNLIVYPSMTGITINSLVNNNQQAYGGPLIYLANKYYR